MTIGLQRGTICSPGRRFTSLGVLLRMCNISSATSLRMRTCSFFPSCVHTRSTCPACDSSTSPLSWWSQIMNAFEGKIRFYTQSVRNCRFTIKACNLESNCSAIRFTNVGHCCSDFGMLINLIFLSDCLWYLLIKQSSIAKHSSTKF